MLSFAFGSTQPTEILVAVAVLLYSVAVAQAEPIASEVLESCRNAVDNDFEGMHAMMWDWHVTPALKQLQL